MAASATTGLIVHRAIPLNAEPPLARLRESVLTPTELFYVRTHGPIPRLDPAAHRVRVAGRVATPLALSLADLASRFPQRTVTAVLQCAGNRRADLQAVNATSGDPWSAGAIGNAAWTGVLLADLLRSAGVSEEPGLHVAFEGGDAIDNEDGSVAPYGASIPLHKALDGGTMVATLMNGAPLAAAHGAPARVVVPGYAGVRSVKWLTGITVQDHPSRAYQQAQDYLLFPPDMRAETEDVARGIPIEAMPLNAAICLPGNGAVLRAGPTEVRGYAIAAGRAVVRVDVSANGGRDWVQATLEPGVPDAEDATRWSWTFWRATVPLVRGLHELACRAWDSAGQTQPAEVRETWNFKGYLCTAWHRVRVRAT